MNVTRPGQLESRTVSNHSVPRISLAEVSHLSLPFDPLLFMFMVRNFPQANQPLQDRFESHVTLGFVWKRFSLIRES